jgi:hypothetical protein
MVKSRSEVEQCNQNKTNKLDLHKKDCFGCGEEANKIENRSL